MASPARPKLLRANGSSTPPTCQPRWSTWASLAAATSALDRLGLGTVAQLLTFPTADWNRAQGVGLATRREVLAVIGGLRERLDVAAGDDSASVDRLAAMLLPKPQTAQAQADLPVLRTFLGITDTGRRDQDPLPIESRDDRDDGVARPERGQGSPRP